MNASDLESLRSLLDAATGGEWGLFRQSNGGKRRLEQVLVDGPDSPIAKMYISARTEANAALIVALKNNAPALLDLAASALTLREYVKHQGDCFTMANPECTCGLGAALARRTNPDD